MVWTKEATLSQGTAPERYKAFFDTYLSALTNWTVTDYSSTKQTISYGFTDAVSGSSGDPLYDYLYYWWDIRYTTFYGDLTYATAPQDQPTYTRAAVYMQSTITSPWQVWTDPDEPQNLMMTDGSKGIAFLWIEPLAITLFTSGVWSPSSSTTSGGRNATCIFPLLGTSYWYCDNKPGIDSGSTSEYYLTPMGQTYISSATSQLGIYNYRFKNFTVFQSSSSQTGPYPYPLMTMGNGIQLHLPAGASSYDQPLGGGLVTIFDGTDYYIRTNPAVDELGYLLPVGPTDPGDY